MIKKFVIGLFLLGLIYILLPGPRSVNDFPPLLNSIKSDEIGDTSQVPNLAAYFSQFQRDSITKYYYQAFSNKFLFGKLIPPIVLNYPPQYAYTLVRDQLYVTFLEEYLYPLKGSVFVAGYEPKIQDDLLHRKHTFLGDHIHVYNQFFVSKTTLRYYPASLPLRLIVYFAIWAVILSQFYLIKKIIKEKI